MSDSGRPDRPEWWSYPLTCPAGHPWAPGRVIVGWMPCDCPGAMLEPGRGHLWVRCRAAGCDGIWYRPEHSAAARLSRRGAAAHGWPRNWIRSSPWRRVTAAGWPDARGRDRPPPSRPHPSRSHPSRPQHTGRPARPPRAARRQRQSGYRAPSLMDACRVARLPPAQLFLGSPHRAHQRRSPAAQQPSGAAAQQRRAAAPCGQC